MPLSQSLGRLSADSVSLASLRPPPGALQAQLIRMAPLGGQQRAKAEGAQPGPRSLEEAVRGAAVGYPFGKLPLTTPRPQPRGAQKTRVSGPSEQANSRLAPRLHLAPECVSRPRQVTTSPGGSISQARSSSWERAGLAGFSAAVAGRPFPGGCREVACTLCAWLTVRVLVTQSCLTPCNSMD